MNTTEKVTPPPPPAKLSGVCLALAALILLPACWGGSAGNSAGSLISSAPAPSVTPPTTTPDTPDPDTGDNGNGSMMPMLPSVLPIPEFETLFTAGDRTGGGIGRLAENVMVDNQPAILLVMSNTGIGGLLDDPTTTELLSNTAIIDYGAWSSASPQSVLTGTAITTVDINGRGTANAKSGTVHAQVGQAGGQASQTYVYIDDHAAVVLGYEAVGDGNLEFTMLGEPLSRMPTAMTATYSGFANVAVKNNAGTLISNLSGSDTFDMEVNFGTAMITGFTATFGSSTAPSVPNLDGTVTASGITINANGDFSGTAAFAQGAGGADGALISANDANGSIYGQFHGDEAVGVTGAFHNSDNSVLGGFAGSKEPPAQ